MIKSVPSALAALVIALSLASEPAWSGKRLERCRAALESNSEQLKRSNSRIKAIYERQRHTRQSFDHASDRLLNSDRGDGAKALFVQELLRMFNDSHQAFVDLGNAWIDRETLLRNLGKLAVRCVNQR